MNKFMLLLVGFNNIYPRAYTDHPSNNWIAVQTSPYKYENLSPEAIQTYHNPKYDMPDVTKAYIPEECGKQKDKPIRIIEINRSDLDNNYFSKPKCLPYQTDPKPSKKQSSLFDKQEKSFNFSLDIQNPTCKGSSVLEKNAAPKKQNISVCLTKISTNLQIPNSSGQINDFFENNELNIPEAKPKNLLAQLEELTLKNNFLGNNNNPNEKINI